MSVSGHPSVSAENNTNQQLYNNGTNSVGEEEEEDHEYLSADHHEKGKHDVARGPMDQRVISYGALQRPPVCNANIYGNCIVRVSPHDRPCTYFTRCCRHRRRYIS
ncbi:protein RALF-like 27 [Juglans microcarpa x Juglans regia]|uniref:protein RALF-like 27 n=1 Tax=Juglans microcarpa x Juglans regia TaxID=2249226 RepID=UPI001B7E3268|nr:protein RALF-like 27 [Juglans microcarpa x Juglans regia]